MEHQQFNLETGHEATEAPTPSANASITTTPTTTGHGSRSTTIQLPTTNNQTTIDTNMVIILAALLCALICALGINSIVRCALRCSRRLVFETPGEEGGGGGGGGGGIGGGHGTRATARLAGVRGLKKSNLRQIPIIVYGSDPGMDSLRTSECIICLGEFIDGEKIRVLPKCNHGFHVSCIDTWLLSHSSCPTCRQSLVVANSENRGVSTAGSLFGGGDLVEEYAGDGNRRNERGDGVVGRSHTVIVVDHEPN